MKITRKNVWTGFRALAGNVWRPAFLKELTAHALEFSVTTDVRRNSPVASIPLNDPRLKLGTPFKLAYEATKGNTSLLEEYVLLSLMRAYNVHAFFEFGTYLGQTSYLLAKNLPGIAIHTLDLPARDIEKTAIAISVGERRYVDKPVTGAKFLGTPEQQRITQLSGDSAAFDYTPFEGTMDCVFVDGCHDEAYVRNDTRHALQLLQKKGMILWHDYLTYESVSRSLNVLGHELPLFHIQDTSLVLHIRA
ncbi:MAG: class I SAM-dependent methyltransferase [Candidatus Peribacteraceae bacterium]|nr:class I SAM-dependent methyltransferase [Candidatus Peribacteraceae bacterium]MDD5741910.1 class I SAM-dependent methyltransferase [Candidatus Peribacteraceae bacterium]